MLKFTDVVALKTNESYSYCYLLPRQGRENMGWGRRPGKCLKLGLFRVREVPFLNREDTTKKGTFILLLKRAGV